MNPEDFEYPELPAYAVAIGETPEDRESLLHAVSVLESLIRHDDEGFAALTGDITDLKSAADLLSGIAEVFGSLVRNYPDYVTTVLRAIRAFNVIDEPGAGIATQDPDVT